ncbi:MAG: hypothetical protein JNJ54_29220 [Myxococcaceae bacterium]|nr:hypothetical protein [Myxococcaceae bacterium]
MRTTLLMLVCLTACGASTTQTRRTFPVEVVVTAPTTTLESGWTLSELTGSMALTELRFFEGRVLVAKRSFLADLLLATAHAHPGHYAPGASMGEVLMPLDLDLSRRDSIAWGEANAVTGPYGSAKLGFGAGGVRVKGVATKAGQTVRFDTGAFTRAAALEGLRFEHDMDTGPGRVRLEVDLGVLLSRVEFDKAGAPAGPDGVITFAAGSAALNGFDRGVTDTSSYRFTWQAI